MIYVQHTKESIKEMIIGSGLIKVATRHGEEFAIVDSQDDIDRCMYKIVEVLAPEALDEYRNFYDPINNHKLIQGDRLVTFSSFAYAGCAVPEVLEIALDKAGIEDIWFENIVMEYGFSDQFVECDHCSEAIYFFPSSGEPDVYYRNEYGCVCSDCFHEHGYKDEYLKECINNPRKAVQYGLVSFDELYAEGFEKYEDSPFYNGLHEGMVDRPEEILKHLHKEGYTEVLFTLDKPTPFYTKFSAWVRRKKELE